VYRVTYDQARMQIASTSNSTTNVTIATTTTTITIANIT
jgi:hypothetical protein